MGRGDNHPPPRRGPIRTKKSRKEFEADDDDDYMSADDSLSIKTQVANGMKAATEDLKREIALQIKKELKPLVERVTKLEQQLQKLMHATPDQEQKHRNLIIGGLPETPSETPKQLEALLSTVAHEMGLKEIDYDEAYRLGKPKAGTSSQPTTPRPVIIKLIRKKDKFTILNHKKQLYTDDDGKIAPTKKFAKVYFTEDLTPEERKHAANLRSKLKELKEQDATLTENISNGKLLVRRSGKVIKSFTCKADGTIVPINGTAKNPSQTDTPMSQ